MLSDRAPGLLRRLGGDVLARLSERIDAGAQAADVLRDPRLPESDAIVHVAVWAAAVVLVGWAVWTWRGLVVGAAVVFAASLVVEFAQGRYTDSREVQTSDIEANAIGIVLGTVAVAACYLLYSGVCTLAKLASRPREPAAVR